MGRIKSPAFTGAHDGQGSAVSAALARDLRADTLARLLEALKKQWKCYRKGLKECQKEFSEPAVHNSRVETRRLCSMIELLGPFLGQARLEKARTALKRHLDTFDDLRDTHVQLLTVQKLKHRFSAVHAFAEYLSKREKRFTRRTRKEIKRIKTNRLGKFISASCEEIGGVYADGSSKDTNAMLLHGLRNAFGRTARLKAKIDPADTSTIHRTRVAFKRFRYMAEIVTGLIPGSHKHLLCAMHDYQTLMGVIQDAEVLLAAFNKFLRKKKVQPEGSPRLREELLRRRQSLVQKYLSHSDELFAFDPFPGGAPPGSGSPLACRRAPKTGLKALTSKKGRGPGVFL